MKSNLANSSSPPTGNRDAGVCVTTTLPHLQTAAVPPIGEPRIRPELLSPAGNFDCARAAVENGADAIYFGLDSGFNARHRAANFNFRDLPKLMSLLRLRGVRGYVTLNTLVFESELTSIVSAIEKIASAGVDAVLVQDFGVARLVREICPELEIHASTQMSLTSAETIAVAAHLSLSRVVVARELSVAEIAKITAATLIPIEVFIHGALCVAYSGQCLTSESLGGRSANRGQCAQACRLPYDLICDGEPQELGEIEYLLSPQDLAGYDAIPALIGAGVSSLKIEGRLKTPQYVAGMTAKYRSAIDAAMAGRPGPIGEIEKREMELSFSRGFTSGWLDGNDHKRLVPGLTSSKQGIPIGRVLAVRGHSIRLVCGSPVATGDGIAVRRPGTTVDTVGGRIFEIIDHHDNSLAAANAGAEIWIDLGRGFVADDRMIAARVYKNDDPALNKRLAATYSGPDAVARRAIDISVSAIAGNPLKMTATIGSMSVTAVADENLQPARNQPIAAATLREKIAALGGTTFELRRLESRISGDPMVPLGQIKQLRRTLCERLEQQLAEPPMRTIDVAAGLRLIGELQSAAPHDKLGVAPDLKPKHVTAPEQRSPQFPAAPRLLALCRTTEQTEAAVEFGVPWIYVDYHDVRRYRRAAEICRGSSSKLAIASVRIQKPGEMGLLRVIPRSEPDAILCRNLAAVQFCRENGIAAIGDFSLNVTNSISADWLRSLGLIRVTAAYDLNGDQLFDLLDGCDPGFLEVVIHQHMPMFHMEHCVFCSVLSPGTNKTNCGRPCDRHIVQLRDRVGANHELQADVACRNTLFNERPQSAAEVVPQLLGRGVHNYRVEFLQQDAAAVTATLALYRDLISARVQPAAVWRTLNAANRVGVTRGTLETAKNPLAIL